MENGQDRAVGSNRAWELGVAVLFFALGALVVWDSRRLGAQWASDGPQAGYFPFYIGLIICIASVANALAALGAAARGGGGKPFVMWSQLKMVLTVMAPSVVYVALISNPVYSLGIYEASVLFIGFFMRFLGNYRWPTIAAVSVGVMTAFFLMFEVWFLVPLPKGPIEALIGFS
jgi:putative tricarboxylic transport membrane protein